MNDVTIIGAGVSSVFLAYTLMEKHPDWKVHVIDKGKPLAERACGLDHGEGCTCEGGCSKYIGFAGLGKSEGKFNLTTDFGGQLPEKIGEQETMDLMYEVDRILCSFGTDRVKKYSTKNEQLSKKAESHSLKLLSTDVRHLGTQLAGGVFQKMYEALKERVTFSFETDVASITRKENDFLIETKDEDYVSDKVVLATGMSGSQWMLEQTRKLGLKPAETRLDLGIRVEMRKNQWDEILKNTFETKLQYTDGDYTATTYCMNPYGRIVPKHQHGLVMPDGQNQHEENSPSGNLNFTLFIPKYFESYEMAFTYAERVVGGINDGSNRIVVQRFADLLKNRPTEVLMDNKIAPTIEAEGGNLHEEVPALYIRFLLEFFEALEGLLGEKIDPDTLLYGIDSKFYESKIYTDESFQTSVSGLYLAGDCSGETHSLSQAAASGIYLESKL
ncbi:FAD-dependent oxidoreductase [Halobacillus litoralis]|uniref:NAD(FAD)-utilizing dehydrogenase n=1 Tax=Halobacillus litoralis TaxID=45668 RepID=A0A410MIK8_9BACI|nr:NAD(FAD)-utilizing dehydrogenase [Halobacillus litoralis]QAS54485.1 NAD(FAD)-utilizing dehydrogenase [Halobacillus litoralis]